MGLFSKHPCVFCDKQVGFLSGKKIHGGDHICKECEKNCSAFIEVSRYDKAFLEQHMEYMNKQDILYKKEFEALDKKDVFRFVRSFNGIVLADSIGMFEIISPRADKKNKKELFRYDQIQDFRYYAIPNTNSQGGKKYAETGLEIDLRSVYTKDGLRNPDAAEGPSTHPYVASVRIPLAKDTDDELSASLVKNRLNELFGRASETVAGSIKQKFTGTGQQKATREASWNALKSMGSMAKAAINKDGDKMEQAKANLTNAAKDALQANLNYGARYTEIANLAEKRAWEE